MSRPIWNCCGGLALVVALLAYHKSHLENNVPPTTAETSAERADPYDLADAPRRPQAPAPGELRRPLSSREPTPRRLGHRATGARALTDQRGYIIDKNIQPTGYYPEGQATTKADLAVKLQSKDASDNLEDVPKTNGSYLLGYDDLHRVVNGRRVTKPFYIVATGLEAGVGDVHVSDGSFSESRNITGTSVAIELPFRHLEAVANMGPRVFEVRYVAGEVTHVPAATFQIALDTRGPFLEVVRVSEVDFLDADIPTANVTVELEFERGDLDPASVQEKENYYVERVSDGGGFDSRKHPDTVIYAAAQNAAIVHLKFSGLARGVYRLNLPGQAQERKPNTPLKDRAGNYVGGQGKTGKRLERYFGIEPEAKRGAQVEFPEFLPTTPQPDFARRINPADRVETRVMRMFYFRDAHRVAQLINRTAESLNKQPVALAQRRAEDARVQADRKTDDRRSQERKAVQAAEKLRRAESEAETLDIEYTRYEAETRRLDVQVTALRDEKRLLEQEKQRRPGEVDQQRINRRLSEIDALLDPTDPNSLVKRLEDAAGVRNQLATSASQSRSKLETLRNDAAEQNEAALALQAAEDRAREQQFRLEVAAADEDPDTYAAGKTNSVDPVAQCSVSVIGEGLLQIRGPRKGIDKIRTMVHQIDMPLGQVKVEIVTVQLNGERGERMERPLGRVEAHLGLGRFLTNHSLMLLRQAIVAEAAQIAQQHGNMGHLQVDRDRKYLYAFFGRDFIDELYAMDSEFLYSENKILGLHSMDAVSLHQALFVLALAKNDVRQRILARFEQMVHSDLVEAEFDFRRTSELWPHKTGLRLPHTSRHLREEKTLRRVCLNNAQRYHFRNLRNFFAAAPMLESDTINPLQREFIKLAQIFKSRLITELELKQRVIERAMMEDDREFDLQAEEQAANSIREMVLNAQRRVQQQRFEAAQQLSITRSGLESEISRYLALIEKPDEQRQYVNEVYQPLVAKLAQQVSIQLDNAPATAELQETAGEIREFLEGLGSDRLEVRDAIEQLRLLEKGVRTQGDVGIQSDAMLAAQLLKLTQLGPAIVSAARRQTDELRAAARNLMLAANPIQLDEGRYRQAAETLERVLRKYERSSTWGDMATNVRRAQGELNESVADLIGAQNLSETTQHFLQGTRRSLQHRKLLDFFIEEEEERLIDLLEGTRAQISQMDNYLKRMMTALEDDFNSQFYDPAFVRIRSAAREWDVSLGQVERTSILTNNRAFAKVTPQATMEFDLPKRNIAIVEAFDGAKALLQDYGALANDPTFLAAAQLMGAGPPNGKVQNLYPGLPSSTDEQQMGVTGPPPNQSGSALQSLVPDPAIYKFETGTGYEIRPVIQPDGYSVIYDFNYMYTTNVREPVRADEKHLGRIKRHFINTQVQTSSFDMRELSRYHVALKASRTSKGVPLLEDVPLLGMAFRPLPSDESSIQQNVILGRTVVYPTVFDLMGLRWAPSVVGLSHESVRDSEHVVRGRYQSVRNSIDKISRRRFDELIGIPREAQEYDRPDLYYRQRLPSPYHPSGYRYEAVDPSVDPTRNNFERRDRRPEEFQQPYYDPQHRMPQPTLGGIGRRVISDQQHAGQTPTQFEYYEEVEAPSLP